MFSDEAWAANIYFPSAALPEQEFHNALDVVQIFWSARVICRENNGFEPGKFATAAFQSDHERSTSFQRFFAKGAVCKDCGSKIGV
jgi:hypothetical protein